MRLGRSSRGEAGRDGVWDAVLSIMPWWGWFGIGGLMFGVVGFKLGERQGGVNEREMRDRREQARIGGPSG